MRATFMAPLLVVVVAGCSAMGFKDESYKPSINPADFTQAKVDNPYFPLVPGTTWKYVETDKGETSENVVTVTHDTKTIMGVTCVVVHDVLNKHGHLAEDTYDWYAQDKDGTVWYFGEATKEISPGGGVSTQGSWEAGVSGQPGMIMPANPTPGKPYRQEYSANNAEDMGQVVTVGESVKVPAGEYNGCVKTKDWSLLESGSENKWYARGIGFVKSQSTGGELVELISITQE